MINCIIGGEKIDRTFIRSIEQGFGQRIGQLSVPEQFYYIEIDFDDAITAFNDYYFFFIDNEKGDENSSEGSDQEKVDFSSEYWCYHELSKTGYLPLKETLTQHPILATRILKEILPTEFLGYVFGVEPIKPLQKHYSFKIYEYYYLTSLDKLEILNEKIICQGLVSKFHITS